MTQSNSKIIHRLFFLFQCFGTALQLQVVLVLGFVFCLGWSLFYSFVNDPRFPQENLTIILAGIVMSGAAVLLGNVIVKKHTYPVDKNSYFYGAWVVTFTWAIACTISALFYVFAGFPDPLHVHNYTFFRQFTDGWFDSMSGFTTTGSSALPSIEVFPRSVIMWHSLTHEIGGMGIAFMAVSLWKRLTLKRESIINAEAESPNYVTFKDEREAIGSGIDFLKIYGLLTSILITLLILSGIFFRQVPYTKLYDNVFDSVATSFSVMGTGGFAVYDSGAGLPIVEHGKTIIGGLRNPVSEWIMAFFMMFAGMNMSLWYVLFFKKDIKTMFTNKEFLSYSIFVILVSLGIACFLSYPTLEANLRYAFFNVTNVISTTGIGNVDFMQWPGPAKGLLFLAYLTGACVGSTAGGLKFTRFVVLYNYAKLAIKKFGFFRTHDSFHVDGVTYTTEAAGGVVVNMLLYYLIFFAGGIGLLLVSSSLILPDQSKQALDFLTAFTASIANLGNIGPAIAGAINVGPAGNYYSFTEAGKWLMIVLMYIGRVGVFTFAILFARAGFAISKGAVKFDPEKPTLRQ